MATSRKKTTPKTRAIRPDVLAAINAAHPDGVIELNVLADESWMTEIWDRLTVELWRVKGAQVLYEQPLEPPARYGWDGEELEYRSDDGRSFSYRELFLGLTAPDCKFDDEIESHAEDGTRRFLSRAGSSAASSPCPSSHRSR